MTSKRGFIGGVSLVAAGAVAALAVNHVRVSWVPGNAQAAPVVVAEAKPALPPPSAAQVADARLVSRTFAQVAAQLSPSVVRISITKSAKHNRGHGPLGNPFQGTPFERFFGEGDGDSGGGEGPKEHGTGSGVVIDPKGYILTNNHVVEEADQVKVTFVDGKTVNGKVIGTDPKTDLAVVKVDGVAVKAAKLGDSEKLQVGEWLIAIGNPFGFDHSVTVGVLSAKNRSGFRDGRTYYEDFLQTDASINPGNSGGPLVNLDGEVIGINTMIAGIGTGIGFAVPSSMARPVADQLMHSGKVHRPYIGIVMQDLTPEAQKSLGSSAPEKGAAVSQVTPGSPAERAGLRSYDVIVNVDGTPVDGSRAVQRTILGKKIGQRIELAVWRDGKSLKVPITTAELPDDAQQASRATGDRTNPKVKLGIDLRSLTPDLAERLGVERSTRGAVVAGVRDGSPAQEAGIREGDVLLEVDRKAVTSAEEAAHLLTNDRSGGHLLRIRRGDAALLLVIPNA